ncbi:glycoside hydrolase family 16 protein [Gracilimonas tropica]|uniref:glycoside hydrolase family 16 protein n=1 Tax=Gracilimonas tropica TaxID=454600 RepID=UPI0003604561|nr:glycoside hydrolase family 16 protein [Gracilimonas tropica]
MTFLNRVSLFPFAVIAFIITGCESNEPEETYTEIVWQDEFDADGSVNSENWTFDIGTGEEIFGQPGWGNNELQYYTDRPENVEIRDGMLEITARNESFQNSNYTSARILTRDLFQTTYGRFEARIQLPWGQGIWPAFWLLGDDSDGTVSWPQIGEIDIMEYRGQEPTVINGSVHGPGYSAGNAVTDRYELTTGRFDTEFHVFAIEWEPNSIKYYVDDVLYNEITPEDVNGEWVFNDNSFYIILNVAVGGSFVGPPNSSTRFPQTMLVDYIRVYKQ